MNFITDIKQSLFELCSLNHDGRIDYIKGFLANCNIQYNTDDYGQGINIEVLIKCQKDKKDKEKETQLILLAHHDRSLKSEEGANDNSSSVVVLLFLLKFYSINKPGVNLRIIFNDCEEIIGAIYNKNLPKEKVLKILEKTGSYRYFSKIKILKSDLILILELSGIGDSIYVAESSGGVICDTNLNNNLISILQKLKLKHILLPVPPTDLTALYFLGIKGSVIGSIPFTDGNKYLESYYKKGFNKENMPYIWKKINTSSDTRYSIQEKSLKMIYNYLIKVVEQIIVL